MQCKLERQPRLTRTAESGDDAISEASDAEAVYKLLFKTLRILD
jgi:hypothetical protein